MLANSADVFAFIKEQPVEVRAAEQHVEEGEGLNLPGSGLADQSFRSLEGQFEQVGWASRSYCSAQHVSTVSDGCDRNCRSPLHLQQLQCLGRSPLSVLLDGTRKTGRPGRKRTLDEELKGLEELA